jgi:hypothetical protein
VVGRRGTAAGVASGGGGRQLSVREGCTRRHGARGGDGEFGGGWGGAMRWLNGGGNGDTVGVMGGGGRKEAPRWGVGALYSYQKRWTEGGAAAKPGVGNRWWGSRGCSKVAAAAV